MNYNDKPREELFTEWQKIRKDITLLEQQKDKHEEDLIIPFAWALAKKYSVNKGISSDDRIIDDRATIFKAHLELLWVAEKEQIVHIAYTNKFGETEDFYEVAVPHFINCDFDENDTTSNDERIENENKKNQEKKDRAEYERLKKKYEGNVE